MIDVDRLIANVRNINGWVIYGAGWFNKIMVSNHVLDELHRYFDQERVIYGVYPPAYARSSIQGFQDIHIDRIPVVPLNKYSSYDAFNYLTVPIDEVNLMITLDKLKLHHPAHYQRYIKIRAGYRILALIIDK